MPQFLSPGAAAQHSLEDFMLRREMSARQARLDAEAAEDRKIRMDRAEKLLQREEADRALKLEDREAGKIEKEIDNMVIGDIPTEDQVARAKQYRVPIRMAVKPPAPVEMSPPGIIQELSPDGASGQTPVAEVVPGDMAFAGSPAQVKEAQAKEAQRKFIENLSKAQPAGPAAGGTGAALSAAARAVNLPMSAADFEPPAPQSKSATLQEYEYYKNEETAAGRQPLGFDAYQARDANRHIPQQSSSGTDSRVNSRVARFDNSVAAKNFESVSSNWERAKGIDENASGAPGASQDAMLIYTFAKTMDPASAVREGEYNTVQDWATAVLPKYGFKLEKIMSPAQILTPDARRAIKAEIGKAYKAQRARYNKGVETLGQDLKRIGGANQQNWRDAVDDDDESSAVPTVGGTFNGGKVLKVTPVN